MFKTKTKTKRTFVLPPPPLQQRLADMTRLGRGFFFVQPFQPQQDAIETPILQIMGAAKNIPL